MRKTFNGADNGPLRKIVQFLGPWKVNEGRRALLECGHVQAAHGISRTRCVACRLLADTANPPDPPAPPVG